LQYGFGAGYYADPSSGLIYIKARWYDPLTSTWTSKDPIGFPGGNYNSLYRYVGNNPVTGVDPSGLKCPDCTPHVYLCDRTFVLYDEFGLRHTFFWIHNPCFPWFDTTISYGPPGAYRKCKPPVQDDDIHAIQVGEGYCHRTNCDPGCVISAGSHVRKGDAVWDPKYFITTVVVDDLSSKSCRNLGKVQICWGFTANTASNCACGQLDGFPDFWNGPNPDISC
jgi:RHS repeat-associated protein